MLRRLPCTDGKKDDVTAIVIDINLSKNKVLGKNSDQITKIDDSNENKGREGAGQLDRDGRIVNKSTKFNSSNSGENIGETSSQIMTDNSNSSPEGKEQSKEYLEARSEPEDELSNLKAILRESVFYYKLCKEDQLENSPIEMSEIRNLMESIQEAEKYFTNDGRGAEDISTKFQESTSPGVDYSSKLELFKTRLDQQGIKHRGEFLEKKLDLFKRLDNVRSLHSKIKDNINTIYFNNAFTSKDINSINKYIKDIEDKYISEKRMKSDELLKNSEILEGHEGKLAEIWKSFEIKMSQLEKQKLDKAQDELKIINKYLTYYHRIYGEVNNSQNISSMQSEWNKNFHQSLVYKFGSEWWQRTRQMREDTASDGLASIISGYKSELEAIQEKSSSSEIYNDTLGISLQNLQNTIKLSELIINNLKAYNVTLSHLWNLSHEITRRECIQRSENLPRTLEAKSAERMSSEWRDKNLQIFYRSSAKRGEQMELNDQETIKDLLDNNLVTGKMNDYYHVETWPIIPDSTKSLEDSPPYQAYISSEAETMINFHVYREREQLWRKATFLQEGNLEDLSKTLKLENPPEGFFEALSASDTTTHQAKLIVAMDKGNDTPSARTQSPQSDVPPFPVRTIVQLFVKHSETCQALSTCVKPGEKKTFYPGDEGFSIASGTRMGIMKAFQLHQNQDFYGRRESTSVDVRMNDNGDSIDYMIWHTADSG